MLLADSRRAVGRLTMEQLAAVLLGMIQHAQESGLVEPARLEEVRPGCQRRRRSARTTAQGRPFSTRHCCAARRAIGNPLTLRFARNARRARMPNERGCSAT